LTFQSDAEERERLVSTVLKYTFLLHFLVAMIFGVAFFLIPELFLGAVGWPVEVSFDRTLGALFIGLAICSLLAFREESFDRVEIIVMFEIVLTLFGMIAMLWNMLTMTLPVIGWLFAGLFALFFILFLYSYMTR
jgi:hypothetical protein